MVKAKAKAKKAPSARVQRILRKREPQLVEGPKYKLLLKGTKCSEPLQELLRDLGRLGAPLCKNLSKRNDVRPFEAEASLEFMMKKNDCALFAMASHSKKRPHNLVLGRTYDHQILDMVEFGVVGYKPLSAFSGRSKATGAKPMLVFNGDEWEQDPEMAQIKNLLLDHFRGAEVDRVALAGLDHVTQCAVEDGTIRLRTYLTAFKKSGGRVPRVELEPMGPAVDLVVRRTKFASAELAKHARRKPKGLEKKKQKNVSRNAMGDKVGRLYVDKQDVGSMQVRRTKALRETTGEMRAAKRAASAAASGEGSAEGSEGGRPKRSRPASS